MVDLAEAVATAAGKWWSTIEVHKTKQNKICFTNFLVTMFLKL